MTNHEELVGICCVCSDDQGFPNNVLVYCDGKRCRVACHTSCYGIISIPDGKWYCRRCEVGEMQAPCRLCPLNEGAMKQTSDGNWAHVVCALYIPEVSFGNDETMEPIILSKVPSMRYGKTCSICIKTERSKADANKGACCKCIVKNCPQAFHVTCAQQVGLLYEDVRKDNCQYPIYCEYHRPKVSKFLRQIPVFRYQTAERKQSTKEKDKTSDLLDYVDATSEENDRSLLPEERQRLNDETNQNACHIDLLTNFSQCSELTKEEQTSHPSLNQNQSIKGIRNPPTKNLNSSNTNTDQQSLTFAHTNISSHDNNNLSMRKNLTRKIKTEEDSIDYETREPCKDKQSYRKRQHSNNCGSRPVGRPPSKKTLLSRQKLNNHSTSLEQNSKTEGFQRKSDQIDMDSYSSQSPLNNSSISKTIQRSSFSSQTLEEFLEQEWELTSDFLLQQNIPNDISSLLSSLYRFKSENASLKKQFDELRRRRDSLRVINANLHHKLSEAIAANDASVDSSHCSTINQLIFKKSPSPIYENQHDIDKNCSTETNMIPNNPTLSSSLSYGSVDSYGTNKTERISSTHNFSLELFAGILATTGQQIFAPTLNISNFGYAIVPNAKAISISDESIIRSDRPFQ